MTTSASMVIFQKNLQDLVKGIRAQKRDASLFISQSIAEIKTELRSTDPFVKAEAVRKLTYLQMIGYNVSWASFSIIEVMAQPRFAHKRIGYLAANQSFTENTDVILLTTNLFKKEFATSVTGSQFEVGLAINGLANIVTRDLSKDCMSDLVNLMNHTRPYIRKKAVLCMYKLYVKYPQGLRLTFDKLKDRLDDPESSVVSCAVNVICELANKNPRNYLAMAPKFFRLLTTSANNWMLIKVVKLLGSLVSEEPRLARKLLEPLATIIQNTSAKSLQYECINTVTLALPYTKRDDGSDAKNVPAVVKLCSDSLRQFIDDVDQNLKYLGLVGLVSLMASHPRAVVDHKDVVIRCLNDDDVTIRTRALELLSGMVTRKSLPDLVHHLMQHVHRAEGNYRDEVISKILYMGSREKFSLVTDFAWYTSILLELALLQGTKHGKEVAEQLIEISLRVDTVRPFAVEAMLSMLLNEDLILGQARRTVSEVLRAAAWIVGEYSGIVSKISHDVDNVEGAEDGDEEDKGFWIEGPVEGYIRSKWRAQPLHSMVVASLMHPRATNLPPHVQMYYMQAAMKVFVRASEDCPEEQLVEIVSTLRSRFSVFLQSMDVEVQERASTFRYLLSELEILPIDWEETAEEEKVTGDKKAEEVDLLFLPVYTSTSIKAVDEMGAKNAKRKSRLLSTLIAEPFYAVHSKAQRRVPVPDDLDLEATINETALENLLAFEEPPNLTLATLSFTSVLTYDEKERPMDEEEARIDRLVKSSFHDVEEDSYVQEKDNYSRYLPFTSSSEQDSHTGGIGRDGFAALHDRSEDRLFYLGGGGGGVSTGIGGGEAPMIPENAYGGGKKGKGKDKSGGKGGRGGKGKGVEINTSEMLPAGAVDDSSDDEPLAGKKSKPTKPSSLKKKLQKEEGDMELDQVDITTPLRADESLPVHKHRIVPESSGEIVKPSKKGKSSKGKKNLKSAPEEDEKGKSKARGGETTGAGGPVNDLLGLVWSISAPSGSTVGSPPGKVIGVASNNDAVSEGPRNGIGGKENVDGKPNSDGAHSGLSGSKDKEKSGSGGAAKIWLPLFQDRVVHVLYLVNTAVKDGEVTMTLSLKVENKGNDRMPLSADISFQSLGHYRSSMQHLKIAHMLACGAETISQVAFRLESIPQSTTQIQATLKIAVDSLLGPENTVANVIIKIPICAYFSPLKLDEEAFMTLLNKTSSKWASASTKVSYSKKFKSAVKALAGFLHAHVVETEVGKAASLSAKTATGASVCCLAKQGRDGNISVDVKVLGAGKSDGQAISEALVAVISELSF